MGNGYAIIVSPTKNLEMKVFRRRKIMCEDRCIYCEEIVPEGRMLCPLCEEKLLKIVYNKKTNDKKGESLK